MWCCASSRRCSGLTTAAGAIASGCRRSSGSPPWSLLSVPRSGERGRDEIPVQQMCFRLGSAGAYRQMTLEEDRAFENASLRNWHDHALGRGVLERGECAALEVCALSSPFCTLKARRAHTPASV